MFVYIRMGLGLEERLKVLGYEARTGGRATGCPFRELASVPWQLKMKLVGDVV